VREYPRTSFGKPIFTYCFIYRFAYNPVMNWKTLITDLLGFGLTQAAIADAIKVKQPTISGILSGAQTDMRWSYGERLRKLHLRESRKHSKAAA
jgi:hypothetical protein